MRGVGRIVSWLLLLLLLAVDLPSSSTALALQPRVVIVPGFLYGA
jgi:hypothetical protein